MTSIVQTEQVVNAPADRPKLSFAYSPKLIAANVRLQQLRVDRSSEHTRHTGAEAPTANAPTPSPWLAPLAREWTPPQPTPNEKRFRSTVKLYASLGLAMLQQGCAAEGRIWLLCHHLDVQRSGWLAIDRLREKLTAKDSELRTCGWRQLRKLLQRGIGRFWTRDAQNRLWLKGTAHVAAYLGLEKVRGSAIQLPVSAITNIQTFRAHCYACFFHLRHQKNPITRAVLAMTTGVHERTQPIYERLAGVDSTRCIAIGERYTDEVWQEQAWQRQNKTFVFVDHHGQQGRVGAAYVAWHLPNQYQSNLSSAPRGRQQRINQQLRNKPILVNHQGRGNHSVTSQIEPARLFYESGHTATKARRRAATQDIYWERQSTRSTQIWSGCSFRWYGNAA